MGFFYADPTFLLRKEKTGFTGDPSEMPADYIGEAVLE
jgi:hypothetical protein